MAGDDHQQLIDEVIGLAREQLKQNGMLDFTVLTVDEQGLTARMDIDTEFFRSEANKDRLKRKLRQDFREKGIASRVAPKDKIGIGDVVFSNRTIILQPDIAAKNATPASSREVHFVGSPGTN